MRIPSCKIRLFVSPFSILVGSAVILSTLGCSSDDATGESPESFDESDLDRGYSDTDGSLGGDGDGSQEPVPLPEEIEDEVSYRAPVATGRYLWSANPESGRVALIDVEDLSVRVLAAGLNPTFITSISGGSDEAKAIVLNSGSSDATRFVVSDDGISQDSVATHVGANRWSVSDSGRFAIAWTQAVRGELLDSTEGLQEITVLDLSGKKMRATRLTVGYRPSQVMIDEKEETLIVVSDEDITLIDLTNEPSRVRRIDLGFEAELRDVSLSADGTRALVRRTGLNSVDVIDLTSEKAPIELIFSGPVTDVDLSPSGRGVAIIRDNHELATFELSDVLDNPSQIASVVIEDEFFGSAALTPDGKTAILYTNAIANDRVSLVDLRPDTFLSHRSLSTQSPVFSVTTTPDGMHAAVLAGDGLGGTGEAFSLVALKTERFARIEGTSAPVSQVALSDSFGLITASSSLTGVHEAHLVEFPNLSVNRVQLSTEPLSAGVLAHQGLAYAAQVHSEGRVTFFEVGNKNPRTLTGYELSAEVVDQ